MNRMEISEALEEIANILEIKGENPFRSRAYHNASRILEGLTELESLVEAGELTQIKGIGQGLSEEITEMVTQGKSTHLKELRKSIPEGVLDMLRVPGLGPKKVKVLYEELELQNLGELEYACKENRLLDLKGFGEKTQTNVLKGIELLKKSAGRYHFNVAWVQAHRLKKFIAKQKSVLQTEIAGSLRRHKETIGDIDILASLKGSSKNIMKAFREHPEVEDVLVSGDTKTSVRLKTGIQVDLRVVSQEEFPFALLYFTGSKEHNTALRQIAKDKNLKLNEYGLFKGKKSLKCKDEAAIYQELGLHFVPPELRENLGEIQYAKKKKYPRLLQEKDIRGTFHAHTTWSDGSASVLEMGKEAERLGLEYLGLSDHSQTAFYAGGLKPKELKDQAKEIQAANKKLKKCVLLQGTESDILNDGSLDYTSAYLKNLEFVIASIHSGFKMEKKRMTQRILKAIGNPFTRFVGHISGRLLLARDPFELDYAAIFTAAAKHQVVIEINSNPHRFDLDWRYLAQAKEAGVKFSLNPDAHSPRGLSDTFLGVGLARKGGLTADDVINTLPLKEVRQFLARE